MIAVSVDVDINALNKELEKVPGLMQASAFDAGLRPAGRVVQRRLRDLTPRSSRSGSTRKWSQSTRQKRAGEEELHRLTAVKMLRPKNRRASVLIGYRWPKGNKGHFVIPMKKATRRVVLWGRKTRREVRKGDDILKRSLDETREQAAAAFTSGVTKDVQRKLSRLNRG